MTAQRNRYHKHIFAGSERIATKPCGEPSRTKGGGIPPAYLPPNDQDTLMPQIIPVATQSTTAPPAATDSTWDNFLHQTASCLGVQRQNLTLDFTLVSLQEKVPTTETQVYYYHTDHLGSSGFISRLVTSGAGIGTGRLTQHYQYLPFGENFIHQKGTNFGTNNPYEFNGKEKDLETGYNYYGARHYNASWGVPAMSQAEGWLSVDPLAEKNLHESNYVFSSNNPINRVDPNGMDDFWVDKKGTITLVEGTQNNGQPDRLIAGKPKVHKDTGEYKNNVFTLDTKNGDFGKSIEPGKGTAKIEENGNIIKVDYIGYAFRDVSHNMEGLYNFLQDNTNVEFSLTEYDENGKCGSAIATSRDRRFEAIGGKFATAHSIGGTLRRFTHGHPYADAALDGVGTAVTGNASGPDKKLFHDLSRYQAEKSKNGITKPIFQIRYDGKTKPAKF